MTRVTARSDEFPLDVDLMSVGQLERRGRPDHGGGSRCWPRCPSDRIQMKDVSERSGVALGTLYRYFPTKQQLLAAAMTAWSGLESVRRPEKLRADGGENNAYERVLALHRREMKAFERRPYFARLEIELHSSSDQFVIESLDLRAAAHRRMLFELMDGVPAETARVAAVAIGGTMLTALALWTSGRIGFAEAPAERRRRHRTGNSLNGCNLEFSSCFCCHERELSLRLCENEDGRTRPYLEFTYKYVGVSDPGIDVSVNCESESQ